MIKKVLPVVDVLLAPAVYLAAWLLKGVRRAGMRRMRCCEAALLQVGVFPILNHYYEPLFDTRLLRQPLGQDRELPGIRWNTEGQLQLLRQLRFGDELKTVSMTRTDDLTFYMGNHAFGSGDAEYLYSLIRLKKPAMIVEIGSGHSTLMASKAIKMNHLEDAGHHCRHVCIEPYEAPWLEQSGVTVIREKVENLDKALFAQLDRDDILFIDSSHVIRPQGDVLFEILEILPSLKVGVIVHVHDIFSPRDYLKKWVVDGVCFWNEQYLLEAFLTHNSEWQIIGALNCLHHKHYQELKAASPFLTPDREPGSFYIQKIA